MSGEPTFAEERAQRVHDAISVITKMGNVKATPDAIRRMLDRELTECEIKSALRRLKAHHEVDEHVRSLVTWYTIPASVRESVAS